MAIYSKYHQEKKETVSIRGELMNNTCIYSDIILPKDTVRVYNIHLASNWLNESDYGFISKPNQKSIIKGVLAIIRKMKKGYKRRAEEADAISRHMQSCPHPIIICGDFNDTPLSYAYQTIKGSLTDGFRSSGKGLGTSFINLPGLRIDYILHDPSFKSINYKKHNQVLSDHHPISCDIIIP
jgi:endonuclease/exonuclease/phosphatase family metal-dependent hydrolase